MTTSIPHTNLRLRDLSELVAGVPYIIGFPPTDSLVLFTFRRYPELALSSTIRVNLPLPDHVLLVAEEMAAAVALNQAAAVIAVVVAENGEDHRELIDMLRKTLEERDILLTHASWVPKVAHGEVWQCFDDPLCTSTVPDPQSSALAAATAVAGDTTYPDREAMAAHLASDPEEMLAYRKKLLNAYRTSPTQPYTDADSEADLEILGYALDKTRSSRELPTLTDHQMVRLGRALAQGPVKDECLAMSLSDEPEAAERLWTVLIRGLPAPERAEPAFLLAMSAYLRGAGVIAALALKIVMESNPLHRLAVLLDYALQKGVPPDHLRNLLVKSVLRNHEEHTEPTSAEDDPPWDTTPESPSTEPDSTDDEVVERSGTEPNATAGDERSRRRGVASPSNRASPFGMTAEHAEHKRVAGSAAEGGWPSRTRTSPAPEPPVVPAGPSAHEELPADHEQIRAPAGSSVRASETVSVQASPPAPAGACSMIYDGLAVGPWWNASTGPFGADANGVTTDPDRLPSMEPPRIAPGPLSRRAAVALGVSDGAPGRRTVTMNALTAFLPPPTDQRGPG